MLYIKEISKDKKFIKVIYDVNHPEIEFIWQYDVVKNAIKNGKSYKTIYEEDEKLLVGANVYLNGEFLTTHKNNTINDNLNELKTFEI